MAQPAVGVEAQWKGADDTSGVEYLLTRFEDGAVELATRDAMRGELSWGPPVTLAWVTA